MLTKKVEFPTGKPGTLKECRAPPDKDIKKNVSESTEQVGFPGLCGCSRKPLWYSSAERNLNSGSQSETDDLRNPMPKPAKASVSCTLLHIAFFFWFCNFDNKFHAAAFFLANSSKKNEPQEMNKKCDQTVFSS